MELGSHLHNLVPAGRHDNRVGNIRAESNAGYPERILREKPVDIAFMNIPLGVTIILDIVLALSQSVPELDRSVA